MGPKKNSTEEGKKTRRNSLNVKNRLRTLKVWWNFEKEKNRKKEESF